MQWDVWRVAEQFSNLMMQDDEALRRWALWKHHGDMVKIKIQGCVTAPRDIQELIPGIYDLPYTEKETLQMWLS